MIGRSLYAAAGEMVCCAAGHDIGALRRDLFIGDSVPPDAVVGLDGLREGDIFPACRCGAPFACAYHRGGRMANGVRVNGGFYFRDGFRIVVRGTVHRRPAAPHEITACGEFKDHA